MTSKEFRDQFWLSYCLLEDEFSKTIPFVTVEEDNYDSYSIAYSKLLLEIGSEVDIVLKYYCQIIDQSFSGSNICHYKECIFNNRRSLIEQKVQILNRNTIFVPWSSWSEQKNNTPSWWTVYNKVKHDRNGIGKIDNEVNPYYKFANLKYTLEALAGLFVVSMYTFIDLTEKEGRKQIFPRPLSRLFDLLGGEWKDVKFTSDPPFLYTVDGTIIYDRHSIL